MAVPTTVQYQTTTIFQWNSRSLQSKVSDFRQFAWRHKFPLMCISECGLRADFRLSNYITYVSKPNGMKSRAATFIRSDIPAVQRNIVARGEGEYVCCSIRVGTLDLAVVSLYIPPAVPYDVSDLENILDCVPTPYVLCGDFNAHHTMWGSVRSDSRGRRLAALFEERNLHVLNDGSPTFVQSTRRSSCLDLTVVSASIARHLAWSVGTDMLGSDHVPVLINIRGAPGTQLRRAVKRTDWQAYKATVDSTFPDPVLGNANHGDFCRLVVSATHSATKVFHLPTKFLAVDAEYARLRAIRRRAERRARRTHLLAHTLEARRIQKAVHRHICKLARDHWRSFASSLSPRTPMSRIWTVLKGLTEPVTQRDPFRSLSVATGRSELQLAEEYCGRLTSQPHGGLALTLASDIPIVPEPPTEPSLDQPFSLMELESALCRSPMHTSPGADHVTYKALRNLPLRGRQLLLQIFNESWRAGSVPQEWKMAVVVPILKPGKSPHDIDSFRPIALTSCVAKTMERMIHSRLSWYFETTGYFPEALAGFRQGRSSIDNVIDVVSSVQQAQSEGKLTAAVFLDVMKAYDSVLHSAVVATLQESGVGARMTAWIRDFLSDRTLLVRTTQGETAAFPVHRGVPQGSVLSPLLFNLIMASLPTRLPEHTNITIYADDICIWTSAMRRDAIQRRLQDALNSAVSYLADRGLRLSPSKTVAMAFTGRSFISYPLHVSGTPLPFVSHCKYLGVIIDKHLSWSRHIKALSTKTSNFANVLRRVSGLSWGPSCDDLRRLHNSLVLGLLRYSLPVLHDLSRTGERELLNIQARSLRVCLGLPTTTETYSVLAEARETPAHILRDRETLRVYTRLLTRHPFHYLRLIQYDCPNSAFGGAVGRLREVVPLPSCAVSFAPPLWALDRPLVCFDIPGLGRKNDTPPIVARQLALEHLSTLHDQRLAVYTDGSVVPERAAAAFCVPHEDVERTFRLANETSSTEAELFAVHAALVHISASPQGNWSIFTDSKATLEIVCSHGSQIINDLHSMTLSAYNTVLASGHSVWLQWIPSHIGLTGNTRADAAARRAHSSDCPVASLPLTPSACRLQIRRWSALQTRQFIEDAVRCNEFLRAIDPAMQLYPTQRLTRAEETLLHRLRLNVAYTPSYLHKIGRRGSATCTSCDAIADVAHLLLTCPTFSTPRAALARRLQALGRHPLSLATLLGPVPRPGQRDVTKALLQYLKDTELATTL